MSWAAAGATPAPRFATNRLAASNMPASRILRIPSLHVFWGRWGCYGPKRPRCGDNAAIAGQNHIMANPKRGNRQHQGTGGHAQSGPLLDLKFRRRAHQRMSRKSGCRFSDKDMRKRRFQSASDSLRSGCALDCARPTKPRGRHALRHHDSAHCAVDGGCGPAGCSCSDRPRCRADRRAHRSARCCPTTVPVAWR